MDNKITGKRVAIHFEYDWLKYVLVILASIFLSYVLFTQINATRESEKLDIFFATYKAYVDESTFESEIKSAINNESDYKIRAVNIAFQDPLDTDNYPVQVSANTYTADVMILPESDMKQIGHYFVELTPEFLTEFMPEGMNAEFYTYNPDPEEANPELADRVGKNYGVRIDNLINIDNTKLDEPPFIFDCVANYEREGWADKITDEMREYDNKFYLVFNPSGTKIGKYTKDEDYRHLKQSFIFARYFLERFNVSNVSGE